MTPNELQFIESIQTSKYEFEKKLTYILKHKVVMQLSRNMIDELFDIYLLIAPKFNKKAVCMTCNNSTFAVLYQIANKYFEYLKQLPSAELEEPSQETTPEQDPILEDLIQEDTIVLDNAPESVIPPVVENIKPTTPKKVSPRKR